MTQNFFFFKKTNIWKLAFDVLVVVFLPSLCLNSSAE